MVKKVIAHYVESPESLKVGTLRPFWLYNLRPFWLYNIFRLRAFSSIAERLTWASTIYNPWREINREILVRTLRRVLRFEMIIKPK